jgi:hypothetical protein
VKVAWTDTEGLRKRKDAVAINRNRLLDDFVNFFRSRKHGRIIVEFKRVAMIWNAGNDLSVRDMKKYETTLNRGGREGRI